MVNKSLKTQNSEEYTKTYHWFFCDIVKSSDPTTPTIEQLEKIQKFYEILSNVKIMKKKDPNRILVPTGDGYVIAFSDSSEKPLLLAIDLLKGIEKYNKKSSSKRKLSLRIGLDVGPVFVVKDLNKKNNFWGPGIITAKRVMDAGVDNHILASKQFADNTSVLRREYKSYFHPIGEYITKHRKQMELYNVYGKGFGNKIAPRKSKVLKRKEREKDLRSTGAFEFRNIDVILDVTDTKTMLTHHTWIWDIVNVSPESKDRIFYYIDGDSPKEFAEMNIKVTDDKKNKLSIVKIDENKPQHKKFYVELKKPMKPRQRLRHIQLEYDWEQPERTFSYKLATNCKKFTYHFTIPNDIEVKNKALKFDPETGYKWDIVPPVKFILGSGKKKTKISWEGKNLKAHDAYKFEW